MSQKPIDIFRHAAEKADECRTLAKKARKEKRHRDSLRLLLIARWYTYIALALSQNNLAKTISAKRDFLDPLPTGWRSLKISDELKAEMESAYKPFFLQHRDALLRVTRKLRRTESSKRFLDSRYYEQESYRDRLFRLASTDAIFVANCRHLIEQDIEAHVDSEVMPLLKTP